MTSFDLNKRYCYWFNEISKIPHGSRNEKAISDYIVQFAIDHELDYKQDDIWNVIIEKKATPGYEDAEPLILQVHIDMVNEKNQDCSHDFLNDPLDLYVDGEGYLRANGTTLGCDDGYGVSYMMAILESDDIPHPYLQCFFTVQEEVGLIGAQNFKKEDIKAKRLINLDGGGETSTSVTSAGSVTVHFKKNLHFEPNTKPTYRLSVRGLKGGHSGGLIHLELGNSIVLAATALKESIIEGIDTTLVSFNGGMKFNAIPREADIVFVSETPIDTLKDIFAKREKEFLEQLQPSDGGLRLLFEEVKQSDVAMSREDSDGLLNFVYLVPNGFQHKSLEIEGLTLASSNLGVIETHEDYVYGEALPRSAVDSYSVTNAYRYQTIGQLCGVEVWYDCQFSGWRYSPESKLRDIYASVLEGRGQTLTTVATHGCLETGIFKGIEPEMDIICVGPISFGAHTPDERLDLASYDRAFEILKDIIAACH